MELTDPRQQLYPGQLRHRFACQHDADQALVVAKPGEQTGRIVGGSNADDLVVGPVPLAQLPLHDASRLRVVIDDQQDWSTWHGRHLWAWLTDFNHNALPRCRLFKRARGA